MMLPRILTDMEMWILLFAAGSSYIARCWTKSLRMKENFSNTSNDIESVGSFSHSVSSTERQFGRRKGRRLKTKYAQNFSARSTEKTDIVEDYVHNEENVREVTTQWCQLNESFDGLFPPVNNMMFSQETNMTSSEENNLQWDGGYKILPQHQVVIEPNNFKMGHGLYDGDAVPGFSSVSECSFDQVPKHLQQKSNRKYHNFSGKLKVGKISRKQRITPKRIPNEVVMKGNPQNNFSGEAFEKSNSETDGHQHTSICQRRLDFNVAKTSTNFDCTNSRDVGIPKKEDMFYGLTSLPRKPVSQKRIKDSLGYSNPYVRQECDKEGISESLLKCLLFNIGVGIGMMTTIKSNRQEAKHLIRLLQDAEWLLEDLECMLSGRSTKGFAGFYRRNLLGSLTEPSPSVQIFSSNVRSAKDLLNYVSGRLFHRLEPASVIGDSKEMSRLEAELEAELERMELDMKDGFISKRYPAWNEFDFAVGGLPLQEPPINNILRRARVDEKEENCSCCCSEDAAFGYSGVSPMELANRLYELIEARQEKKILDLETELLCTRRKLQAKEYELHLWKKGFVGDYCLTSQQGNNCTNGLNNEILIERTHETDNLSPIGSCTSAAAPISHNCSECVPAYMMAAMQHTAIRTSSLHADFPDSRNRSSYIAMEGEALALHDDVGDESFETLSDDKVFTLSADGFTKHNITFHCRYKGRVPVYHDRLHDVGPKIIMEETSSSSVPNTTKMSGQPEKPHSHSKIGDILTGNDSESAEKMPTKIHVLKDGEVTLGSKEMLSSNTIASSHSNGFHQGHDPFEMESSSDFNWTYSHYETNFESPEKIIVSDRQDVIAEEHGQFASALDVSTSQESSCLSDLDELFSQSLIERIVEKRRRGSSIIKVAKSMLASLETGQSPSSTD